MTSSDELVPFHAPGLDQSVLYPRERWTLDKIALALDPIPDKASTGHGYTLHYEQHFAPYRHKPLKILEIGVWEGASLALWSEYFPKAQIVGADIDIERCEILPDRCRLWQVDQSSHESLVNMAKHLGPWDVIIDDGSHDPQHQRVTFEVLWPYLRPGGLYCIEDLHVNYFNGYDGSMVRFIGSTLQDDLHARGKISVASLDNTPVIELEKLSGRELEVAEIHLYRYLCIVCKR